jgi:hypothetical protein
MCQHQPADRTRPTESGPTLVDNLGMQERLVNSQVQVPAAALRLWCEDAELAREIAEVLEPVIVLRFPTQWSDFEAELAAPIGSLLVVCEPPPGHVMGLLRKLFPEAHDRFTAWSWPIVLVGGDATIDRLCPRGGMRHTQIIRRDVGHALLDALERELSRAALRYGVLCLRGCESIPAAFSEAFDNALRGHPAVTTVRALAQVGACDEHTLRSHRRKCLGTTMSFKRLIDVVLLLLARTRKSSRLTWDDVAMEYGTPHGICGVWRDASSRTCRESRGRRVGWLSHKGFARR